MEINHSQITVYGILSAACEIGGCKGIRLISVQLPRRVEEIRVISFSPFFSEEQAPGQQHVFQCRNPESTRVGTLLHEATSEEVNSDAKMTLGNRPIPPGRNPLSHFLQRSFLKLGRSAGEKSPRSSQT